MTKCLVLHRGQLIEALAFDGWWRCMKCRRGRILRGDKTCRVCHCLTTFEVLGGPLIMRVTYEYEVL